MPEGARRGAASRRLYRRRTRLDEHPSPRDTALSLFDDYTVDGFFDEMFEGPAQPREVYARLYDRIRRVKPDRFLAKSALAEGAYLSQGITFSHEGREQAFPLDLLPRLIPPADWRALDAGLVQRVRALNAYLADIYGERRVVADGVAPNAAVVRSRGYVREAVGIKPPLGRFVHIAGVDLVRDAEGVWRVLEDNLRNPSGLSYVIQNRAFMRRVFPEVFSDYQVSPVGHAPTLLRVALAECAPDPGRPGGARIVVLTPGPANSAYFEHAFLAQQLGVPLVEGRDLIVRERRVFLKTTVGREPVDVIYRRIDDDFLDPALFREDSMLGVTGLMQAYREGNVAICNAVGNGAADDKAIYALVPDLVRYYLDEEPLLAQVPTYLTSRPDDLEFVLDNLERLVVKPIDGSGGYGIMIGPHAAPAERDACAAELRADPEAFIAQDTVMLSRSPVYIDEAFRPRHVDLRPFVIGGRDYSAVPGGLTRVALREGSLIVNSSQGGGSKDTWVLVG